MPPGATFSGAHAVNNSGDVVGWALIGVLPNAFRHAVLWRKDESGMLAPTDLGTLPGGTSSEAYGINELGQIVGASTYWDETAQKIVRHAVLWDVADTTPPEIASASVAPAILWPPNLKMVSVTIAYAASDDSGSVACHLGPVTSNELLAGADWEVLDAHHVLLRSERDGEGSGRTYGMPSVYSSRP